MPWGLSGHRPPLCAAQDEFREVCMRQFNRWAVGLTAASLAFGVSAAQAQAPAGTPVMVRGTIEKLDGSTLTIKTREGNDAAIKLADSYGVRGVVKISLADVKPGSRV